MKPFRWDVRKARANQQKHRVTFTEAETVFFNGLSKIHDDPDHSEGERRELIVGHSALGRLLIISFVEHNDYIRIINARKTTMREQHDYEESF